MTSKKLPLFFSKAQAVNKYRPLAELIRPKHIEEVYGQEHILSNNSKIASIFHTGEPHSMILWGDSGTGKNNYF